jgi:hypothetical protein
MNQETKLKVKELHKNGLTFQEIAEYLNLPLSKIEYACSAKRGKEKLEEWIIQRINEMVNQGKNRFQIAKVLNVSVTTVTKYSKQERDRLRQVNYKYLLQAPDGQIHQVSNLVVFCKNNNLNYQMMRKIIEGYEKQYKGWKCNDWKKHDTSRK